MSDSPFYPLAVEGTLRADVAVYSTVGMIASSWSELETYIDFALCRLAGVSTDMGFCLILQIQSTRQKLIALEAIVHSRGGSEDSVKKIRRFANDLEGPTKARNRYIHTPIKMSTDGDGMVSLTATADRTLHVEANKFDLGAALAFGRTIHALRHRFADLAIELESELPPLPETLSVPPLQILFGPNQEGQTPSDAPNQPESSPQ